MNDLHDVSPLQDLLLEDEFIHALIDSVQRNPCVYNRYDPLHRVSEYKHKVWKNIGIEVGYDGQPVELERKWKHIRDKYVRLRKMDQQQSMFKTNSKWYNYYHKMSFLDPFIEHRKRKNQKEDVNDQYEVEEDNESSYFVNDEHLKRLKQEEASGSLGYESPIDDFQLYNNVLEQEKKPETISNASNDWDMVKKNVNSSKIPGSTSEKANKQGEDPLKDSEDDEVNLFIRSISKTLVNMDRKKFAMARIEISKVLYNIEFGKTRYSENGVN